jgi:formate dehydrogenase major subunit
VQGATDVGPNADSLPGYYGLVPGAWQHWCRVWNVDYQWLKGRFASEALMGMSGITVSRWIDGVLDSGDVIDQPSNIRTMFYWGHAPNSQTRGLEMKMAMDKLDLLVVIDPYPSATAAMAAMPKAADAKYEVNPNRDVYLLPAATQFETHRPLQPRRAPRRSPPRCERPDGGRNAPRSSRNRRVTAVPDR